jgi:hypothetical protein
MRSKYAVEIRDAGNKKAAEKLPQPEKFCTLTCQVS